MKDRVLSLLPINNSSRFTAAQISSALGISGPEVRDIINQLRCDGIPVCSDGRGYYISSESTDIRRQISSMEHRMNAMYDAVKGLKLALEGCVAA